MAQYSLEGAKAATTGPHDQLVTRVIEVLGRDNRILAGYLVGSFAAGLGDAFSNVALEFIIFDDAVEELRESWTSLLDEIAAPAHVEPFDGVIGGSVITPDWLRYDVVFKPSSTVDPTTIEGMVPLFDRAGLLPSGPVPRPERHGDPFFPVGAVRDFFYMLGNMVSVVARNEPIPLSSGVILVRDVCLVRLLLAEQGWRNPREHAFGNLFPFTKRLREYLTDEQNALLESLPPVAATVESGIDGYVALARAFLPRARALAKQTSAAWPAAYEKASVRYFERMIGVQLELG